MRTISYKLDDLKKVVIPIGYEGENNHTRVIIDAGEVFKQYPEAAVALTVQPPKGTMYPAIVTRDGDTVTWDVKDSDCASNGNGEAQFTFTNSTVVVKSVVTKIKVQRSLHTEGPAPDPIEDWLDEATEVLDDLGAMDNIAKNAQASDIGKSLSPKTVVDGVVTEWQYVEQSGGTEDYTDLENKPSIAGVTLSGDKSLTDLGIASASTVSDLAEDVSDVKTAIHGLTPNAQQSDIGKALILKTIDQTGKPTAFEYGEAGGGSVDPSVVEQKVNEWLDENITNPNSPPLDRSLSSSSGAIPADIGGEIVKNMDVVTVPHSENLWDDAHKNAGWYHKNGTIYDYAGYYYFDIGAVSENDVIKCFIVSGSTVIEATMYAVVALDSNGNIVSEKSTESVSTFTVPSGAAKLVITIKNPPESTMIVNSIPKPSEFIPYSEAYSYYVAGDGFVPKEAIPFAVEKNGEGQVTAKNLQIIDYSHNMFDLSAIAENYLVNQASGELNAASGHSASDWIPVEEGEKYTFSINESKEVRYVWYTQAKAFISGVLDNSLEVETLTAPENAAFFRFSTTAIKRLYIQFEKGEEATPYRDYGEAFIKPQYKASADQFVLNLPSKIYATTGIELNIYFENLVEDWTKYDWDVKCNRGRQMERGYVYTPVDGDAGTRDITITATKDNVSVSKTATMIVTAKSAGDGDNVSVIVLGDSTTANGTAVTKLAGNFADDPMSITLCGTKGTSPYLHEGRSGWTFYNYVNTSSDNAFYNPSTNKFDADYYFTNTGVEKPDWFFINLGINDTFGSVNDREVMDECSKIKSRCDYIINSILDASPSTKIGLCITIPPNHSQDAFGKDYNCGQTRNRYKRNNVMWVDFLIGEYDGKESEGIYLVPIYTNLDTVYNMGTESNPVNARNTAITYMSATTNGGVHPVESGYWQIADVYTAFLKANAE